MKSDLHFSARKQIVDACLRLADLGFLAGTGGNVSLRIDDGAFAITPSGLDYYSMAPEHICILRIATLEVVEGSLRPSVEKALHATVFRSRQDIGAVVHTHQPLVSAVALLNVPLPVNEPRLSSVLGGRIELVPYAPSGTKLLVRALRSRLKPEANGYILRNHGLICCGANMAAAIEAAMLAESVAAEFLRNNIEQVNLPSELTAFALNALEDRTRLTAQ